MITISTFIKELSKDTQVPMDDILQIYYEGRFEQYLIAYFTEFHLTPQCTKACHHFETADYHRDVIAVGIDIDDIYVYIPSFIPKNITKGHWAYFKVGNLTIEMCEDDGFWQVEKIF